MKGFLRELRICYDELLNRVESYILKTLGLKNGDYGSYKAQIEKRYASIKEHLLPTKQKAFYSRIMTNLKDRKVWLTGVHELT